MTTMSSIAIKHGEKIMAARNIEEILREASALQVAKRHDEAIALLMPLAERLPNDQRLGHALALAYGGKAEFLLEEADRLGAMPTADELERIEHLLERASEADPNLADPYWDRAVIHARFRENFDEAATQLSRAKALGYAHPMMPRLEALIHERTSVDQPPALDEFTRLLHQLIDQARGPAANVLFSSKGLGDLRTLDDYCDEGASLVEAEKVSRQAFLNAFSVAQALEGDTSEIVLDFLRRVSASLKDAEVEQLVGNAHLAIVAQMAQYLGGQPEMDDRGLRKARRCAQRGLDIAEEAAFSVDPDIKGNLLIALGQTYSRSKHQDLQQAIPLYLQALDLKKAAGNKEGADRLQDLLKRMIAHQMDQTRAATVIGIGGIGAALEGLKVAYDAAIRLKHGELILETGLALAETLGGASQPEEAIEILEDIAKRAELSPQQEFSIHFVLAARLSETQRPEAIHRAREIGENQVQLLNTEAASVAPQTVWMNLGNFRRLDDDLSGSREAFRMALNLCPKPEPNEVPAQLGQMKMLLAEAELLLGNKEEGQRLLTEAEEAFTHLTGVGKLHFESMTARWTFDLGDPEASAEHALRGIGARKFILSQGPSPDVWESMLREWTRLDVSAVRAHHAIGTPEAIEQALLVAEAAKGRLFAWLARVRGGMEAASYALDEKRQEEALAIVRTWVEPGGRWMVSLFAHREGLSVVGVGPEGRLAGGWLDDFDYDDLRLRVFEPWERGLEAGLGQGDPVARGLAGSIAELLLSRIGTLIGRAIPELADGGEELVLLPHRLFRSIPLAHIELPNGKRLSQCFTRVSVCPSLSEFGRALKHPPEEPLEFATERAFVDADGTLPFARVEGLASVGKEKVTAGDTVSVDALRATLLEPGVLLLSCHGDFDENNPWRSTIHAADGNLVLGELLTEGKAVGADLVILGVCEAGKSRRSLSDEPLSFPTFLVSLGAKAVIAPAWQVEDFSSFLFITRLMEKVRAGTHPAEGVAAAAHELRQMTAAMALQELSNVKRTLGEGCWPLDAKVTMGLQHRLEDYEHWLSRDFKPNEYPFDALDWAGFQIFGYIPNIT